MAGNGELFVVQHQAAPFGTQCRVFAPLYRQITLAGLAESMSGSAELPDDSDAIAHGGTFQAVPLCRDRLSSDAW